jgi:hypothetical protein
MMMQLSKKPKMRLWRLSILQAELNFLKNLLKNNLGLLLLKINKTKLAFTLILSYHKHLKYCKDILKITLHSQQVWLLENIRYLKLWDFYSIGICLVLIPLSDFNIRMRLRYWYKANCWREMPTNYYMWT